MDMMRLTAPAMLDAEYMIQNIVHMKIHVVSDCTCITLYYSVLHCIVDTDIKYVKCLKHGCQLVCVHLVSRQHNRSSNLSLSINMQT